LRISESMLHIQETELDRTCAGFETDGNGCGKYDRV
jgi:hypothetical protein